MDLCLKTKKRNSQTKKETHKNKKKLLKYRLNNLNTTSLK